MSDELKTRLLVVDDEQSIRRLCMTIGNTLGFACAEAESAEVALGLLDRETPDLVLTDLKLPTVSGVELLRQIKTLLPRTEVAIMTGHGSIESAVDAMKLGAYDYIEKPFRVEKMRLLLQRMAEKVRLVTENAFLRERVSTEENRAAMRGLEQAGFCFGGAGKRAFFVAEEFALHQGRNQRSAIDGHEGRLCHRSAKMNRARHQFLARSALAGDQDRSARIL